MSGTKARRTGLAGVLRTGLANRSFALGGAITLAVLAMAALSVLWTPYPFDGIEIASRLKPPERAHWFGTDHFGRDVLSMIMVGAGNSIGVAIIAVAIGIGIGVPLGTLAAARGGWIDETVMRFNDFVFAFPALLSAVMITAIFGPGAVNAMIAIGIFNIPVFARVARGAALSLWQREFILAARAAGKGKTRITVEHILPNSLNLLIVQGTIQFSLGILAEAGLSYLGLGTQPPNPSWGKMLAEAQTMIAIAPHLALFPGFAIVFTVLGLNLLGDGLRDSLDPRLKPVADAHVPGKKRHKDKSVAEKTIVHATGAGLKPGSEPLLEIAELDLTIGRTPVLNDISLSLRDGEIHGIVGESGSGKSMTALTIMRLLPHGAHARGIVRFNGRDLLAAPEREMCRLRGRDIGMVFQEPMTALNPVKTIGQQVTEGMRWHLRLSRAAAEARAKTLLDRVGLNHRTYSLDRFPHQLSGGQRQRVVIAMAIALNPRLLIADEPTTALDVTIQAQILDLLRDLIAEQKMGLILISHDLAVVADMADRITIMQDGDVVETGETAALFDGMAHPYSKMLLNASTHQPKRAKRNGSAGEPLLVVRDLVRDYTLPRRALFEKAPVARAVDGVSFTVGKGASVGLVGESGCGKSTLARTILALDAPQGGTITLDGSDLFTLDSTALFEKRRAMQVVFQDPFGSFNPRHRVERLIAEPLHLSRWPVAAKERRDRVADSLTRVGLSPDDMHRYPHEFSGGQRQRIAIARALITHPKLIVADEPVSALDVSIRARILDLLAQLQRELGLSFLFISHDLTVVKAITDTVLVMKDGRIVERGPTATVFNAPQHAYTKTLLAAAPDLDRALVRRRGE